MHCVLIAGTILNSDSLIVMVLKLEPFNAHSTKNNGNWLPVSSISVSIQFPSEHFIKVSCLFELSKLRNIKFSMLLKCFRGMNFGVRDFILRYTPQRLLGSSLRAKNFAKSGHSFNAYTAYY